MEEGIDYYTKSNIESIHGVTRAEFCRRECHRNLDCDAWTWGKARHVLGLTDVCFLKTRKRGGKLRRLKKRGVISGERCKVDLQHMANREKSLYCWALMQPSGYERGLLALQFRRRASIFACDEYRAYSNRVIVVADSLQTGVVRHNLTATYGGKYYTALNTMIFAAVWRKVIEDGRYKSHDWTVKVDPDTVFLPERLRLALQSISDAGTGVYLNNCKYGLHGPLEAFSRIAVSVWAHNSSQCFHAHRGWVDHWGEDYFIDQCLRKLLSVRRVDEYSILEEDHCDPPKGWRDCRNVSRAAFHPFKKVEDYERCLNNTLEEEKHEELSKKIQQLTEAKDMVEAKIAHQKEKMETAPPSAQAAEMKAKDPRRMALSPNEAAKAVPKEVDL